MKFLSLFVILYLSSPTTASQENCVEQSSDPCSSVTEYNAYITCIEGQKRQKRSAGCPLAAQALQGDSCEFVDCQSCQEVCLPDCPDCECPSSCRQCCSETCTTNLCCHKTCHNQCKTNYCRTECKKDCKDRINQEGGSFDSDIGVSILGNTNISTQARHNITTIINLHNIINNTNMIDIPIKINNTNYNNITLKRSNEMHSSMSGGSSQIQQPPGTDPETGEKCCYVVSPRQCVKTNTHPFMKCFHYRHKKCGPFCISTIVHAQNQNYCDETGCHNKIFYVPQVQPKCFYTPQYPFVNCGGQQTFHNCQGCYDHVSSGTANTGIHHHMRCSRCYDNGGGRSIPPGAMSQYPAMPMGYPMGYPGGYPMMYPMMPPMAYPMYGAQYGQQMYGQQFYRPQQIYGQGQQFYGQGQPFYGQQFYGQGQQLPQQPQSEDNEVLDNPTNYNELNMNYPVGSVGHYVHETVIPADRLLKSGEEKNETDSVEEDQNVPISRYALISIDPAKSSHHEKREDKKERKFRRRKDKFEHEHTTEKKEKTTAEHKTTMDKKS